MKIRDVIFDSKAERELYESLQTKWAQKVAIYPQIPLIKLISSDKNELESFYRQYFPSLGRNYFYQAHIDFTVCDIVNHPLLAIEFDGVSGGVSSRSSYLSPSQIFQERELKLNFKVKLAYTVGFPLLVISYQEAEPISPGETLTILDGIIGSCIASQKVQSRAQEHFKELTRTTNGAFTDEDVQTMVGDTGVEMEMEWDPIAKLAVEYQHKCFEKGIHGYSMEYCGYPEAPPIDIDCDTETLRRRIEAMDQQTGVGCRVRIETPDKRVVVEEIVLRNFEGVHVFPIIITENIAKYRAFKKALLYAK